MYCDLIIEKGRLDISYFDEPIGPVDAIIPRIGASVTQRGGTVIQQFSLMGIYSSLTPQALMQSRDKLKSLQILAANHIDIPKSIFSADMESMRFLLDELGGVSLVIKLLVSTQGMGVILSEKKVNTLAICQAFQRLKKDFILQEFIREAKGTDIRILVVDGQVIAAMERKAMGKEFRSNLHLGGTSQAIEITSNERAIAIQSTQLLGLKIAGVDILRSHRGPLVMEVNASPGLEGIETTTGINVSESIIQLVERDLGRLKTAPQQLHP